MKYVIGVGEGAGANVLARFGLAHPSRCLGLILINVTGSAASVLDVFKTKFISWKGDEVGQSAEDFLLYHKFGYVSHHKFKVQSNPVSTAIQTDRHGHQHYRTNT